MGLFYRSEPWEANPNNFGEARPRNHIICIDGTFDHPDASIEADNRRTTNVYRLWQMTNFDDDDQISRYQSGVGIEKDDDNRIRKLIAGGTGKGARRIRRRAYYQFIRDYRRGDRVFIFGYSRGAAIARTLANEIAKKGIPKSARAKYVPLTGDREVLFELRTKGKIAEVESIRVLGLFDTVPAFGIPFNKTELFKNLDLAPNVERAIHLVATSEDRQPFDPTLLDCDDHVEEVWLPGVHSDVGGGATDRGLSDLALDFMLSRVRSELKTKDLEEGTHPEPLAPIRDQSGSGVPRKTRVIGVWKPRAGAVPRIHESVVQRWEKGEGADPKKGYRPDSFLPLWKAKEGGKTDAYELVPHES